MKNKVPTSLMCIFAALLIITGSIALPIYIRPFYYCQIDPLGIPAATGYDKQTVIDAYDEVLDYLTIPNRQFGTGVFPHSDEGTSILLTAKCCLTSMPLCYWFPCWVWSCWHCCSAAARSHSTVFAAFIPPLCAAAVSCSPLPLWAVWRR